MSETRATGIVAWGRYVPHSRLDRSALAAMFNAGSARGIRSVAGPDEDTLTMGVEAARIAVRGAPDVATCWFATSHAPMLDRGNAASIAAVVGLSDDVAAYDVGGSIRSGVAALRAAATHAAVGDGAPSVAVLADLRFGLPGSDDEINGGDGAAAFVFGVDPVAVIVSEASVSSPVMDRWRSEGDIGTATWDDRWTAEHQVALMERVAVEAVKRAGLAPDALDAVVVSCPSARAEAQLLARLSATLSEHDSRALVGYAGTADVGLRLSAVLDHASPGQHVLVVTGADGADAFVIRTTDRISDIEHDAPPAVGELIEPAAYLLWRGLVERSAARRPPAEPPAAPAVARNEAWKFAFTGSACTECGTRHLPPSQVCMRCGSIDAMEPVSLRDSRAVIRTYTIDRIAQSVAPPVVVGVVDFDGGGRYRCELADAVPEDVRVGDRVEMVYRLVSVAPNGVRNYFWKARPITEVTS